MCAQREEVMCQQPVVLSVILSQDLNNVSPCGCVGVRLQRAGLCGSCRNPKLLERASTPGSLFSLFRAGFFQARLIVRAGPCSCVGLGPLLGLLGNESRQEHQQQNRRPVGDVWRDTHTHTHGKMHQIQHTRISRDKQGSADKDICPPAYRAVL